MRARRARAASSRRPKPTPLSAPPLPPLASSSVPPLPDTLQPTHATRTRNTPSKRTLPPYSQGLAAAAGVFYNYSGALECLDAGGGPNPEADETADFWDYQW